MTPFAEKTTADSRVLVQPVSQGVCPKHGRVMAAYGECIECLAEKYGPLTEDGDGAA